MVRPPLDPRLWPVEKKRPVNELNGSRAVLHYFFLEDFFLSFFLSFALSLAIIHHLLAFCLW